jgi:hypothetical protein
MEGAPQSNAIISVGGGFDSSREPVPAGSKSHHTRAKTVRT